MNYESEKMPKKRKKTSDGDNDRKREANRQQKKMFYPVEENYVALRSECV